MADTDWWRAVKFRDIPMPISLVPSPTSNSNSDGRGGISERGGKFFNGEWRMKNEEWRMENGE